MEISRTQTAVYNAPAETQSLPRQTQTAPTRNVRQQQLLAENLPLEVMQDALDKLPAVDMEKIAEVKAALARGEIALDNAALAKSMLSYHRGSDQ
jgi:negative regulator of flagellin synthesis FlgM